MKKFLVFILVIICGLSYSFVWGDSSCIEDKELDAFIKQVEQKVVFQEDRIVCLKGKYARIIGQKKELLEEIEQDKRRLEEKRYLEQMKQKREIREHGVSKLSTAGNRERQMDYAFEQTEKKFQAGDVDYLARLIKKQRELCATVIQLEQEMATEEKNLNLLKEKRKFLSNQK